MDCALCGAPDTTGGDLCPACERLSSSFTRTLDQARDPTGPAHPLPASAFDPGHAFGGRYTIVELVGAGGMGQVYKAIDKRLNRTVALKLIRPGLQTRLDALRRFRRELSLAQQVSHPNVCRVHDLGEVEGALYISMEFVHGQASRTCCARWGISPPARPWPSPARYARASRPSTSSGSSTAT